MVKKAGTILTLKDARIRGVSFVYPSEDASAAHSNCLHNHLVLFVAPFLLPVRLAWFAQQAAHWDFAIDGDADHGAVFLHGEGIDASCT